MKSRIPLWLFPVLFLFLFLPLTGGSSRPPDREIRLQILARHTITKCSITLKGGTIFSEGVSISPDSTPVTLNLEKKRIEVRKKKASLLTGRELMISSEAPIEIKFSSKKKILQRFYRGKLQVYAEENRLLIVNITPLEVYVKAAARAELGPVLAVKDRSCSPGWRGELTEAMEIVIRSYILHMKNRHSDPRYNFCDLTHCVHFPGTGKRPPSRRSISEKKWVILNEKRRPHAAFFHASSGGVLSGPEIFWHRHRGGRNYRRGTDSLPGMKKNLSWRSPHETWETRLKSQDIEKIFNIKNLTSIKVHYRQKRAASLELFTREKKHTVSAARFMSLVGKSLGWNRIKSNLFSVKKVGTYFIFTGRGLGHGIGLSQWSAGELACRGRSAGDIIVFFYNKPNMSEWPERWQ